MGEALAWKCEHPELFPGSAPKFFCHFVSSLRDEGAMFWCLEWWCPPSLESSVFTALGKVLTKRGCNTCWLIHQESPTVNTVVRDYVTLFPPPEALGFPSSSMSWCKIVGTRPYGALAGKLRCALMSINHQSLNLWGRAWTFIHTLRGHGKQLHRKPSLGSSPIPLSSSFKPLLFSRLPARLLHSWLRMSPLYEKTEAVWHKLTMFLSPPSH